MVKPGQDASFYREVQNLNLSQHPNPSVMNQLFTYENQYPGDLMQHNHHNADEEVNDDASDVMSPKMPNRRLPLVSEG